MRLNNTENNNKKALQETKNTVALKNASAKNI